MSWAEQRVLDLLDSYGSLTLSEIVAETGYSRSWAWKIVRRLERKGIVSVTKRGGILRVSIATRSPSITGILRIGILRAAEYPYIIELARRLRTKWARVEVQVYDDPYLLQNLLSSGRVHVAMLPAVTALLAYRATRGAVRIIGGGSGGGAAIIVNPRADGPGHATTMASSMELCAERAGLEAPRTYARSGEEILRLVEHGTVRAGAVWYPYAEVARRRGLRVEECELEACCVLAAHRVVEDEFEFISKMMAESVSWARRRLRSNTLSSTMARLIGMPKELVEASMRAYTFYEEPPKDVIRRGLRLLRRAILPATVVRDAVYD